MSAILSELVFPQIDPLPGSVHMEYRRCGKRNCRCNNGHLHPHFVRRWWKGGRQLKQYVPAHKVSTTLLSIEAYRSLNPPATKVKALVRGQVPRRRREKQ